MGNDMLPDPKEIVSIRNRLICLLYEQGMTCEQIQSLRLKSIMSAMSGEVVLFHHENSERACVVLYDKDKRMLNAWKILRPRGKPVSDAFLITLRGKNAGHAMSEKAIKRITKQASKPLPARFSEHAEGSKNKQEKLDDSQNLPMLRVIEGGRR